MKQLLIEVVQSFIMAALVGGPLFYYFLFVMKP
jgi:ABC-type antimicrobial peptide transport system permease subunit